MSACGPIRMGPVERLPEDGRPVEHLQTPSAALSEAVRSQAVGFLDEQGGPGLGVALVHAGSICYVGAFGWADVGERRAMATNTPVLLSSVSKTFIGIAAMQALESGSMQLDQQVGDFLSFNIDHPHAGKTPIHVRHLLNHTSGIIDGEDYDAVYVEGDPSVDLSTHLADYLQQGGTLWQEANFNGKSPGSTFQYSNTGAALAAHVLEGVSGTSFDQQVQSKILDPLQMNDSGYFLADLPRTPATPYSVDTRFDRVHPWPQYGFPTYPDGLMRTSTSDLAKYLATVANRGVSPTGLQLLQSASIDAMLTVDETIGSDEDGQAIIWARRMIGGEPWFGHNGSDYGSNAELWFHPATGHGFALVMNARVTLDEEWRDLQLELAALAAAC